MVFLVDGERFEKGEAPFLAGVPRDVSTAEVIGSALDAIFEGPTAEEKARGFKLVSSKATGLENFSIKDGVLTVQLKGGCDSEGSTVTIADSIIRTAKQFREVKTVKILDTAGKTSNPTGAEDSRPACLEP